MRPSYKERNWQRTHGRSPTVDEFNALKAMREPVELQLERELRLDEERIADEMEADAVRGITPPDY